MKRRTFLAATGVASITTLAGCGGGGPSTVAPDDIAVEATMTEQDNFEPIIADINEGEAVEWINETGGDRTLRSNENLDVSDAWDPEMDADIADGETHARVFEESGIYTYHDAVRTWQVMCGAVAVGDVNEEDVPDLTCDLTIG